MPLQINEIKYIAHLARIEISNQEATLYADQLSHVLNMIEQMHDVNTDHLDPMSHALDVSQRLRPDVVSEHDQREALQAIAPAVEKHLYLVPKVIE